MGGKKMFFGAKKLEPNVKLGGMASIITSKEDLQSRFYFGDNNAVGEVVVFQIVGDDVFFRPKSTFQFSATNPTFQSTPITSFIDYDGVFFGNPNKHSVFKDTYIVEFHSATAQFGHSCFMGTEQLTSLYQPAQTTMDGNYLNNSRLKGTVDFPNLPKLTFYNFRQSDLKIINLISCDEISINSGQNFRYCSYVELINMPKLKIIGTDPAINRLNFDDIKSGCEIRVHIDLLTANAGAPHADILHAKNTQSAIVKFYDNSGNYVSTL